MNRHERATHLV